MMVSSKKFAIAALVASASSLVGAEDYSNVDCSTLESPCQYILEGKGSSPIDSMPLEQLYCYSESTNGTCPAWQDFSFYQARSAPHKPPSCDAFSCSDLPDNIGPTTVGMGDCTTNYITHAATVQALYNFSRATGTREAYRKNDLGFRRMNDLSWLPYPNGVYQGIALGAPEDIHNVFRPIVDELAGDGSVWGNFEAIQGNYWSYEQLLEMAQTFLEGKDSIGFAQFGAWTAQVLFKVFIGVDLTEEEANDFTAIQGLALFGIEYPQAMAEECREELQIDTILLAKQGYLDMITASLNARKDELESLADADEDMIEIGAQAILDTLLFAGGVSVPQVILTGLGQYAECKTDESFDPTDIMDLKIMAMETVRWSPPVTTVEYIDGVTGERIAAMIDAAAKDKDVFGEDADDWHIRGDLNYYHSRSVNFADQSGPIEGFPGTNRICPGKSLALNMVAAFWETMGLNAWAPENGDFIKICNEGASCPNPFCTAEKDPAPEDPAPQAPTEGADDVNFTTPDYSTVDCSTLESPCQNILEAQKLGLMKPVMNMPMEQIYCYTLAESDGTCPTRQDLSFYYNRNLQLNEFQDDPVPYYEATANEDGVSADGMGDCTTSYITHASTVKELANFSRATGTRAAYRFNELGRRRMNDLSWLPYPNGVYQGIVLGAPEDIHNAFRPILDETMGDGSVWGNVFAQKGNHWSYEQLLEMAQTWLQGKDTINATHVAAWTAQVLFKVITDIDLTEEQAFEFNKIQRLTVFSIEYPQAMAEECREELGIDTILQAKKRYLDMIIASLNTRSEELESLADADEYTIEIGAQAILDTFFFAGGLSVPKNIMSGLAQYAQCKTDESFDPTNIMDLKIMAMETIRVDPPVNSVAFIDSVTGERKVATIGVAVKDKGVYGEDADEWRIRGDLDYYHSRSVNFADQSGPIEGFPGTNRICPGKSLALNMAAAFWKAMGLNAWVPDPSGNKNFIKICDEGASCPNPSCTEAAEPSTTAPNVDSGGFHLQPWIAAVLVVAFSAL